MDFRQLSNYIKVLELKSLSRAAEQLGIGQPALGMQIRALEDELKQQLVIRHSRGIEPTEAGLFLLEHARSIVDSMDQVRQSLLEFNEPRGRVHLGMIAPASALMLADILRRIETDLPQVTLSVDEDLSAGLVQRLQSSKIDLACIYAQEGIKGVVMDALMPDALCFVTRSADYASAKAFPFRDIEKHRLILPAGPNTLRQRLDAVASQIGVTINLMLEVQSEPLIKDLVAQGVAAAILPYNSVRNGVREGRYFALPIVEPDLPTTLYVAYREGRPLSRAATALRELLIDVSQKKQSDMNAENAGAN